MWWSSMVGTQAPDRTGVFSERQDAVVFQEDGAVGRYIGRKAVVFGKVGLFAARLAFFAEAKDACNRAVEVLF